MQLITEYNFGILYKRLLTIPVFTCWNLNSRQCIYQWKNSRLCTAMVGLGLRII